MRTAHRHESDGKYEHVVEANRREFWLTRGEHCGLGLTTRKKPKKVRSRVGVVSEGQRRKVNGKHRSD
jgi:hypothetical protein